MPITNPTVLEDTPTDNELSKAPTSNWAVDHNARDATAAVQGHATAAQITKLDGIAAGAQPGTVTAVSGTSPVTSSGGTTPAIGIPAATAAAAGHATAVQITKLDGIEALADVTDAANVAAAGAVMKSLYDAYTILMATDDDTPIALTVAAQTLIGRITGGTVASLTVAQIKTLLGVAAASGIASLNASTKVVEQPASISDFLDDTAGGTDALTTKAPTSNAMYDGLLAKIPKSLLTEQGDVIYASAASTPAALAHGTAGQVLQSGGHAANPSWATPAPAAHKTTHQDGGTDEISVAALSGLLADAQTPLAHKTSHQDVGADEISLAGLDGEPSTLTTHKGLTTGVHAFDKSCHVTHSAVQSIANATEVTLAFDTERWDTDTIHDTVTNNSRLTCKTAGKYAVTLLVGFVSNATGIRMAQIWKNTSYVAVQVVDCVAKSAWPTRFALTTLLDLAVGDYVLAKLYQNSGAALNSEKEADYVPEFMMHRIA